MHLTVKIRRQLLGHHHTYININSNLNLIDDLLIQVLITTSIAKHVDSQISKSKYLIP